MSFNLRSKINISSNCTFMELKSIKNSAIMINQCSNCTFMELKSVEELRENPDLKFKLYLYGIEMTQGSNTQLTGKSVQIVPLWN